MIMRKMRRVWRFSLLAASDVQVVAERRSQHSFKVLSGYRKTEGNENVGMREVFANLIDAQMWPY
jgi:hypothetical protein